MKEKALEIMRENIEYYYDTKYDRAWSNHTDKRAAHDAMVAVYEALRDLGLVTREEYKAMKAEIHDAKYKEAHA